MTSVTFLAKEECAAFETPVDAAPTVTISKKRHQELLDAEHMLDALEAAGVDNWDGYHLAYQAAHGDDDDEY